MRWVGHDLNRAPEWRFDRDVGWTIDPDFRGIGDVSLGGFRHKPLSPQKGKGIRRVLVLGDSFTTAINLPYSQTYPALLEGFLNESESRPDWEVVSLAVNDWGNAQQLIALGKWGLNYQPDVVVVQSFPFNDFCNNSKVLAYTCSLQDTHRPYYTLVNGRLERSYLNSWRSALRNRSLLFGFLEDVLDPRMGVLPAADRGPEGDLDLDRRRFFRANSRRAGLDYEGAAYALIPEAYQPPVIAEGWEVTARIFAEMKRLTESRRIPLVALVVPFSKTFGSGFEEVIQAFEAPLVAEYGTERFEAILEQLGAVVISVREQIKTGERPAQAYFVSPTDGHFSETGHSQSAKWLWQALQSLQQ